MHPQWQYFGDAVLSTDPRRRIRIVQWLISMLVYTAMAMVLWFGLPEDSVRENRLHDWMWFLSGQAAFYAALRSGWSERFADPALTTAQIMFGVVAVNWGYLILGPIRGIALYPLPLIFAFGAFSLRLRSIVLLTVFALVTLTATMAALHVSRAGLDGWTLADGELRLDATNLLMSIILLPALSLVAARLSALRSRLRSQRGALSAALEEVQRLATHDELTGLANRRHVQERLEQERHRYMRTKHTFSIAIIDIDNFKAINDRLGHAGGDDVLKTFAATAAKTLRTSDLLARWGGEEFLVVLPNTTGQQAQASLERVLEDLRSLPQGAGAPLAFSAGVTEYLAGEPLEETISRADREMYAAKEAGRSRVLLAGPRRSVAEVSPAQC
ncbi:MAG: diguanylate cyclase [Pseudomonadota bacterium]|nr:diguanylate cyclase [Pseudomonadota bacterium]